VGKEIVKSLTVSLSGEEGNVITIKSKKEILIKNVIKDIPFLKQNHLLV
jgi:hypothetical protein